MVACEDSLLCILLWAAYGEEMVPKIKVQHQVPSQQLLKGHITWILLIPPTTCPGHAMPSDNMYRNIDSPKEN